MSLLSVQNLKMHYQTEEGMVQAVDGISFDLDQGETLGILGESGCGKSSIAISLLKLLPDNAHIINGRILFRDRDLVPMDEDQIRDIRWQEISMIFQAAMNALNPVYTVEEQIFEAMSAHDPDLKRDAAREKIADLFELVGLEPEFMNKYPHQYSGGMRQRAVIAMALACSPSLVIADEPTTALDVIVQDRIMRRLVEIKNSLSTSMIYISHDISVVAELSDRIGVMYAGELVEIGRAGELFATPTHPYTFSLLYSYPSIRGEKQELLTIGGEPPSLVSPPSGCRFHPRCRWRQERCMQEKPRMTVTGDHGVACFYPLDEEHRSMVARKEGTG